MDSIAHVLLCSRDPAVIEAVEVTAAAMAVPLRVAREAESARANWPTAKLRLVSTEMAARWTSAPPGRAFLVGTSTSELARCSAQLELPVLPLPDVGGRLAEALMQASLAEREHGVTVALIGASGGLGVSTLTVGLALGARRSGSSAAVVDLARYGGGLDLVAGVETSEGMRWPDLGSARGELGDVAGSLPSVGGVPLLAHSREAPASPSPDAVSAVITALARAHQVVLADCGREPPSVPTDHVVLVVGADVRSVAAARMLAEGRSLAPTAIVVRRGPGRSLPEQVVARTLGAPSLGQVGHHRALPRLAELGLLPVAGPARGFARQIAPILTGLTGA
jgi:secretion/DNA translocation related CpaE-like protein